MLSVLLLLAAAHAQCPGEVREVLSCSSVVSGQLDPGPWSGAVPPDWADPGWEDMQSYDNDLGETCVWGRQGIFDVWECDGVGAYECGGPDDWGQEGPEHVYEFTCQQDGIVDVQVTDLDCDLDIYILDDSCDPSGAASRSRWPTA